MNYHLDYETFGTLDLTEVGAHKYAEHKDTEILMASIATDDEGPYLFTADGAPMHPTHSKAMRLLLQMAKDPTGLIWAWSAMFEWALTKNKWRSFMGTDCPVPAMDRFRCVSVMARCAGLPPKLETFSEHVPIRHKKDKEGRRLILKFSIPQRDGSRVRPTDDPADFQRFGEYCLGDNDSEREAHRLLEPFKLNEAMTQAWILDQKINDRGLPVNVPALRNAKKIIDEANADLVAQFQKMTGLNPTQRDAVKLYLDVAYDLKMPDMTADTIEEKLKDEDHPAYPVLLLYSKIQYSAVKKVQTMLDCVCDDGYVKGTLQFYGAGTGRHAGRLIQPQNFKRPTIKGTDIAFEMIKLGCTRDDLDMVYGNSLEVISSCIRNFIICGWDADYASIEARIVNWLAGQENILEEYRTADKWTGDKKDKPDQYRKMAATIYGILERIVDADQREVGKRAVLGCGYSMAAETFKRTCWEQYGIFVTIELAEKAVAAYRARHPKVKNLWYLVDKAAHSAVSNPGTVYKAGDKLRLWVHTYGGIPYLLMRIPSGRSLAYPWPKLEPSRKYEGRNEVTFFGHIKGNLWGRVGTYGGKLVENADQATAFDIMIYGAVNAEKRGYQILTLIHDQALALRRKHQTVQEYVAALTALPQWAEGLPITAEGKEVDYYKGK
jgi:DNA polymerase